MLDTCEAAPLGIIEGFFGKPWPWEAREANIDFLSTQGFDFYIYAPKDDRYLRQKWRQPWPFETESKLQRLRQTCTEKNVRFGLGITPYDLHLSDSLEGLAMLREKVKALNALKPDILCILFDDMRGDIQTLAAQQLRIVDTICEASTAPHFIVCPTYYTSDPILDTVFGERPAGYLEELGRQLDKQIDIFWTGEKVCSRTYSEAHLEEVANTLNRQPFLWDNAIANDGKQASQFLKVAPIPERSSHLLQQVAGVAVNPTNQAFLSRIPLLTFMEYYRSELSEGTESIFRDVCLRLCGNTLGQLVLDNLEGFESVGYEALSRDEALLLKHSLSSFKDSPYAEEISAWLAGEFKFDPACLT